ncbi:hypothetical protein LTR85_005334 [Meristemomyces frigidus]|nr:hypothetical protein LTR85_005334 [Meristemomyces frigidus]
MKPDNSQSLLLKLPAELRNRIYEEVLLDSEFTNIRSRGGISIWHAPAILQTCRTIRIEAKAMYYGSSIFFFSLPMNASRWAERNLQHLKLWLHAIGAEQSSLLQRVYLDDCYYSGQKMVQERLEEYHDLLAKAATPLKHGTLYVERGFGGDGQRFEWVLGDGRTTEEAESELERQDHPGDRSV